MMPSDKRYASINVSFHIQSFFPSSGSGNAGVGDPISPRSLSLLRGMERRFSSPTTQGSAAMQPQSTANNGCCVERWEEGEVDEKVRRTETEGCMGMERDWYRLKERERERRSGRGNSSEPPVQELASIQLS